MDRIILHCDCNSFYASCEEKINPELKNIPMAVAGDPESRHGIILAKNLKAKKLGVVTAEPIWKAEEKCPGLVCVPPHRDYYVKINKEFNEIYLNYTDLVEPASIDESYLDVTNSLYLFADTPEELALILRNRIKNEIGITISIGVSFCKSLAKFGSDYKKPDATTVINRENMKDIYWKSDIESLFMAGKKTTEKLRSIGINTIGSLALADKNMLFSIFGKQGIMLWNHANGIDNDPVASFYDKKEAKSIGNAMTFRRNLTNIEEIKEGIAYLADSVAQRLRIEKKKCTVIQIGIKDSKFHTIQRQKKLDEPTSLQRVISDEAMSIIKKNWNFSVPIRLLSVTAAGLIPEDEDYYQLNMFVEKKINADKQDKIETTLDDIREKFGKSSIKFGYFQDDITNIK